MLGLIWGRWVSSANTSDGFGFYVTLLCAFWYLRRVVRIYADQGYRGVGSWLETISDGHSVLEVVERPAGQKGFVVQPKRWVVERTISWLSWSRRLSKDYEQTTASSQAWIDVSAIRCTLGKLTT